MSARAIAFRGLALATILLAPPIACVDLFHSTSFETACDVDATACAPPSASDGGPTNFCQWDTLTARTNATRACAWLGACAGPIGDNAFGACLVRAMLAYDCAANPNRALVPGTPQHQLWDRLWQAKSCADVTAASFPPKLVPGCGVSATPYEGCFPDSGTLLSCGDDGGAPSFEDCNALGQTCATAGSLAACAGSAATCASAGTSCSGSTQLHDCDADGGPFDLGVDCASVGAGSCVDTGSLSACKPASAAPCTASVAVTCDDAGVATGCPSGYVEQVDCNAILYAPLYAPRSCTPDAGGRPWDVSRVCTTPGVCGADSCTGGTLTSCTRGAGASVDCIQLGFSGCALVQLPNDPTRHAVCVP